MSYMISEEFYYWQNGELVQVDENLVTVGLTDFRLYQLGEVLFLDLPGQGKLVRQGEVFFSIESAKRIHDLVAPVTGIIIEVNQHLYDNPDVLNDDPFKEEIQGSEFDQKIMLTTRQKFSGNFHGYGGSVP